MPVHPISIVLVAVLQLRYLRRRSAFRYCTVKMLVPFTPFRLALIVVVPVEALLASPFDLMVATVTFDEVQVT